MRLRLLAGICAIAMWATTAFAVDFGIRPVPAIPPAGTAFDLVITGTLLPDADFTPLVEVHGTAVDVRLKLGCDLACGPSSLRTLTVRMPPLAAGEYTLGVALAADSFPFGLPVTRYPLVVGRAAPSTIEDYSDLWYLPSESGWGVSVFQQESVMFAVIFAYGSDGAPRWFVAPDAGRDANAPSDRFSGTLYRTTGPVSLAQFDPARVQTTAVGTFSFAANADGTADIAYTVDGASVSKKGLQRQTWRLDAGSATYRGAVEARPGACGAEGRATPLTLPAVITLDLEASVVKLRFDVNGSSCSYDGDFTLRGQRGSSTGQYRCVPGAAPAYAGAVLRDEQGAMTLSDIRRSARAFSLRFQGAGPCNVSGEMGGVHAR